ncbi:nuclear transport factor 2 family protein [Congregibacter brevis]|uniref:Nuclear transport factor 2 family protein n=1 Tax=Congregibacter brevis TaxID=3081201 RepID=A0ABZ0IG62_9GAMM|nr:nuclear transport factor 2 family protein [Congregibacter sp. IMCC45268]
MREIDPKALLLPIVMIAVQSQADELAKTPDAQAFLEMDRQIIEAFLVGDAAGYSARMSDDFFLFQKGNRAGKDYAAGMVSTINCEVSDPLALSSPQILKVSEDAYVLSYRIDIQANCASGDISITLPTPVRASTLWVYKEDSWQIAYHGENAIITPDSAANSPPLANRESLGSSEAAPVGSLLESLLAVESAVWKTWRTHDANALVKLTAEDISFVNVFGDYFANKIDTIANWTGPFCDVDSFALSGGDATQVLPNVAVLTLTGSVKATCGEQQFDDMPVYPTTVYVNDGENWKWAFGFNAP